MNQSSVLSSAVALVPNVPMPLFSCARASEQSTMPLSNDTDCDLAYFRYCFERGELEVDERDFNGVRTQLHNAAYHNALRIAEFLLRKNADASITAEKGYTALHIAVSRGHDYMVGLIMKYSSRDRVKKFIDAKTTNDGSTALHLAAKKNNYEAVRLLLSYGANFEAKDKRGKMPIQVTTYERVRRLLGSAGEMSRAAIEAKKYSLADLNLRLVSLPEFEYLATTLARNGQGHTPLQVAIHSNHLPTVKTIGQARLQRLAPEYAYFGDMKALAESITPLWDNIAKSHLGKLKAEGLSAKEAVREGSCVLFSAWKAIEAFDQYRKTLKDPIEEPRIKIVEEVLEVLEFDVQHYQANLENCCDDDPDNIAAKAHATNNKYYRMLNSEKETDRQSFAELIEFTICVPMALLIKGINSTNLLAAVKKNDLKAAKKCTESSAPVDMDVQDYDKKRPLHIAIAMGNYEMVEFLLNNKANMLVATENEHETPLHVAVEKGHFNIVQLLLFNCDVDKVNDYVNAKLKSTGRTALHLAAMNKRLDIAWTLSEYHAIYCARDNRGKSPSDLPSSAAMAKFFKFIDEVFNHARNGNVEVIEKLMNLERDLLLAVGNACDKDGYSPPQVASLNKHRDIGTKIFKMVVEAKKSKNANFVIDSV